MTAVTTKYYKRMFIECKVYPKKQPENQFTHNQEKWNHKHKMSHKPLREPTPINVDTKVIKVSSILQHDSKPSCFTSSWHSQFIWSSTQKHKTWSKLHSGRKLNRCICSYVVSAGCAADVVFSCWKSPFSRSKTSWFCFHHEIRDK